MSSVWYFHASTVDPLIFEFIWTKPGWYVKKKEITAIASYLK